MTEKQLQKAANVIRMHTIRVEFSIDMLLKEAAELLVFSERHMTSSADCPGLLDAGKRLPNEALSQLSLLIDSLRTVHEQYLELAPPTPIPRELLSDGQKMLDELIAFVSWYEETEEENVQILRGIARVEAANINDLTSPHTLAYTLHNYATISADILKINGPAGGINEAVIGRASALVSKLIDDERTEPTLNRKASDVAVLRRRLAYQLQKRIDNLKSTIHFIFRHHPDVLGEIGFFYLSPIRLDAYRNRPFRIRRQQRTTVSPFRPRIAEMARSR